MIRRARHRGGRAGLTLPGGLVAVLTLALAITVAMTNPATASRPTTTLLGTHLLRIHPRTAPPTRTSSTPAVASPIPPARYGRAGHEVTALVWVLPATAPGCGHMRDLGGGPFRLMGAWAQTVPDTVPVPTTAQLWWLTGHTLPPVEAADHAVEAPFVPGCDHQPAFYVDSALSLAGWLSNLFNALLAGPFNGTAPRPAPPAGGEPAWL
jgi:hypothetical protein